MSMCAKWKRHIKQQVCIVGTLVLVIAQVFLLRHGMRGVNDSSPVAEAAEAAVPGTLYCDWTEGGPEIFVIDVDVKPKPPRGEYRTTRLPTEARIEAYFCSSHQCSSGRDLLRPRSAK